MCSKFMWLFHLHLFLIIFWINVAADIYLHNPRGSNNRLNENTRPRKNSKRLFDSQNNDRGGYNIGGLVYYSGSQLNLEWTNQHSCQSSSNNCEVILQYMCDESMRDGLAPETIPLSNEKCERNNCETDLQYGMHENYLYYQKCSTQKRNMGLFTANQKLKGNTALYTRQNPDGTRYGYECPEERDYYPYWSPTPWKDIAILTNNVSRCSYYMQESENVKSRFACDLPHEVLLDIKEKKLAIPIAKEECEAFTYPPNNPTGKKGIWKEHSSHQLNAPECQETEYTRDNHLGNTVNGQHFSYMWKLPIKENDTCVLRIRYNISTMDFDGWDPNINSKLNKNKISLLELNPQEFNTNDNSTEKGYVLQNNPQVQILPDLDLKLQLAINPAQYGRVFEDRSHRFGIIKRPDYIKMNGEIYNLNVRGKRGNIVQVYPAVEYDFVPKLLTSSKNDYIHIQWTGSNQNPLENDGQGLPGTDRSNIVPLMDISENLSDNIVGHLGRTYPKSNYGSNEFLGLNKSDLQQLAYLQPVLTSGSLSTLDDSSTYFNLGLRQLTQVGQFNFMCTRNNHFSNRDQKGQITIINASFKMKSVGWNGGNITVGESKVEVQLGAFSKLIELRLEEWKPESVCSDDKFKSIQSRLETDLASNVLIIEPENMSVNEGKQVEIRLAMQEEFSDSIHVYRSSLSDPNLWQRLDAELLNDVATFRTERGGVFFARTHKANSGLVAAIVVPLVIILILLATVLYFAKNKHHWKALKLVGQRTQRSLQDRI